MREVRTWPSDLYTWQQTWEGQSIVWNADLINMIQAEMVALPEQGYACLLVGDLMATLGVMIRNNPDINYNGRLIMEFVFNNDLLIVNAVNGRCSGTFTRVVVNSVITKSFMVALTQFHKNPTMSDCLLIFLAAIPRAKHKGQTISIVFCDIAKAYDSVDQELLYLKLDSLGFGGKVKALIQSMYYNDCVQVRIRGASRHRGVCYHPSCLPYILAPWVMSSTQCRKGWNSMAW